MVGAHRTFVIPTIIVHIRQADIPLGYKPLLLGKCIDHLFVGFDSIFRVAALGIAIANLDLGLGSQLERSFVDQSCNLFPPHSEQLSLAHLVDTLTVHHILVPRSSFLEFSLIEISLANLKEGTLGLVPCRKMTD